MKIMAIDPGEKHIGVAITDTSGTIAFPLTILQHISRKIDAAAIADLAYQNQADLFVVGKSLDEDGYPTPASRRADRLMKAIQEQCDIPLIPWDESFSTREAQQIQIAMHIPLRKRSGHLDDHAAAAILQSYLDSMTNK
jgi:putative Holliday junction resolvase